ncbi:hypothetical protein PGTUg99_016616 [Puccinia graminis f. sp. tritici]|uniref:Uncharacterized protein n=1 Tax=Puccinia graminis f. sp. tritici TaxID=56615 RepID=A0A5B0M9P2_PUCGR|nr:hypothetical protein PGTUg99_016616 [Puccinia graminis f. sp. tritici]
MALSGASAFSVMRNSEFMFPLLQIFPLDFQDFLGFLLLVESLLGENSKATGTTGEQFSSIKFSRDGLFSRIRGQESKVEESTGGKSSVDQVD